MSIELIKAKIPKENQVFIDPDVITNPKISHKGFIVYAVLLGLGEELFTKQYIADAVGCGLRTLYRALKELKELGLYYAVRHDGEPHCYIGNSKESAYDLYLQSIKGDLDK